LDFYDNQIERITGISSLTNLRVLMLGKNKISKIENLDELVYLDVLDLHANEVKIILILNYIYI
jgi:leucine-rich repeat-containing protein 49